MLAIIQPLVHGPLYITSIGIYNTGLGSNVLFKTLGVEMWD